MNRDTESASAQRQGDPLDPRTRGRARTIFLVAAGLALGAPAAAQQESAERPDLLADLQSCRNIEDSARRLACFDRAAGSLLAARDSGEVRVVDREEVQETRRGLFGFTLPKLGIFGAGDDEQLDMLESTITGVSRVGRNGYRIQIEEGSMWQVDSAPSRLRVPKPGDAIVLKKASLNSFFIRIAGQIGVKGRRVE